MSQTAPNTPNDEIAHAPAPKTMLGLVKIIKESLRLAQADGSLSEGRPGEPGPAGPQGSSGPQGPAGQDGVVSRVEPWDRDRRYSANSVVNHFGGTWQCRENTNDEPGQSDAWVNLMAGIETAEFNDADELVLHRSDGSRVTVKGSIRGRDGREWIHNGTFDPGAWYTRSDVVIVRGTSYVAIDDSPGECPGPGWKMLAQAKAGPVGKPGRAGARGEKGDRGNDGIGFVWRGRYEPGEVYEAHQVCRHHGSVWIALEATTEEPREGDFWDLMLGKGA